MLFIIFFLVLVSSFIFINSARARVVQGPDEWTIYITNDNCPDYTWGFTEEQTRQSFADIVRSHLDEMKRTDGEDKNNQDRYNMAVTQEALCFVERYPERKDELIQRIKEGRIYVSPYLCNSLWGFQSVESAIRTFYPARKLEKEWGITFDVAEHIEEPSLPWGTASILAGCGIRWLSNPFYKYDSNFNSLLNPPLFIFEGPDGSRIKVVMDPWAAGKWSYHQGSHGLLRDTKLVENEWLTHFRSLGESYPLKSILASGTHGDISPNSRNQSRGFADAIINYNNNPEKSAQLVNAILPQFCKTVDEVQSKKPFMQTIRGCFGHSWDVWPVSLAKYVSYMREGERIFLSAEALLTMASHIQPDILETTRFQRERCQWLWAMLSDHAWNGTNDENKRHNSELRRQWGEELIQNSKKLIQQGWSSLEVNEDKQFLTIFNSLSIPRSGLISLPVESEISVAKDGKKITSQIVEETGKKMLYFMSPEVPGYSFCELKLITSTDPSSVDKNVLKATPLELESPYYLLKIDPITGGLASLIYKHIGRELIAEDTKRTLCQSVYFDGEEHILQSFSSQVVSWGPVFARVRIDGNIEGIQVTNFVTVYGELDRVDFDIHINKPVTTKEERLCHVFPVNGELHLETTGAVIRPKMQPEGDLLPGADTRRFAIQNFIDASMPEGPGITITSLDAFLLRLDLDQVTFEAIGNDQNYREVEKDQNGETQFRFRYSLKAHSGGYNNAEAFEWSRNVANSLMSIRGAYKLNYFSNRSLAIDPHRAIALCLKPADDKGHAIRLWETAGESGKITVDVRGYKKIFLTDLLEREIKELQILDNKVSFDLRSYGFAGLLMY